MVKKYLPFAALAVFGLTNVATAARDTNTRGGSCAPEPAAVCYPETCPECPRCLGPENYSGNPPVCPKSCDGDFVIQASAFYWNSHQCGMEYAIDTEVTNPTAPGGTNEQLNQLASAEYKRPGSHWDWGFKLGLGYCSPCDGWDVNLLWTWYHGKASNHVDADTTDNHTVIPLWTNFVPQIGGGAIANTGPLVFATDAEASWKLKLNLVDLELGRKFWVSRYLAIRPFVGVRYASVRQHTDIEYNGGSWNALAGNFFNGLVDLQNNYRGAGLRAGLGSDWNFGCGWSLYGDMAVSIIYGRFSISHDEDIRRALNPHTMTNILDAKESFRASRAMLDLALGIQWSTMFCSCQYGFTAMLGWEQHMFFDQNQLWRVSRTGAAAGGNFATNPPTLNLTGANIYQQRRGALDAQGWTLTFKFDY